MSVARKLKAQPQTKTFHATMLVTRVEDWWVKAESLDEAAWTKRKRCLPQGTVTAVRSYYSDHSLLSGALASRVPGV
jgi:hypothetical protein